MIEVIKEAVFRVKNAKHFTSIAPRAGFDELRCTITGDTAGHPTCSCVGCTVQRVRESTVVTVDNECFTPTSLNIEGVAR